MATGHAPVGRIRAVILSVLLVLSAVGGATAVASGTDTDGSLADDVNETLDGTAADDTTDPDGDETTDESGGQGDDGGDSTTSDEPASETAPSNDGDTVTADGEDATMDDDGVSESTDRMTEAGGTAADTTGTVTLGDLPESVDTGSLDSRVVGVQGVWVTAGDGDATRQRASTTGDGSAGSGGGAEPSAVGITAGATNQAPIAVAGEGPATLNFTESDAGTFPDSGTATLSLPAEGGVAFDPGNTSAVATVDGGTARVTAVGPTEVTIDVTRTNPTVNTTIHLDGVRFESGPDAGAADAVWEFGNASAATAVEPERLEVDGFGEDVARGGHGVPDGAAKVIAEASHARSDGLIEEDRYLSIRIPETRRGDVAFDTSSALSVRTEGGDCGTPIVSDPREESYTLTDHRIHIQVSCEVGPEEYVEIDGVRFNVSGAGVADPLEVGAQLVANYEPLDRIDSVDVDAGTPIRAHAPVVNATATTVPANATNVTGDGAVTVSVADDVGGLVGDGSRIAVELEDTGVRFNDSQAFTVESVEGNASATVVGANATTVVLEVDGPTEPGDRLRLQAGDGGAIRFDVAADANETAFRVRTTPGAENVTQRTETVIAVGPPECQTVKRAVAGEDEKINNTELAEAVDHWREGTAVPGTCDETISNPQIAEIKDLWRTGGTVQS
jgi:hypothetical protein